MAAQSCLIFCLVVVGIAGWSVAQPECFDELVPSGNNIYSFSNPVIDGNRVVSLGDMEDWKHCQAACATRKPVCHSWTYFMENATVSVNDSSQELGTETLKAASKYAKTCFVRTDNYWNPQFVFGNTVVSGVNCKSPPTEAIPNAPPANVHFSWDHVPVFIHCSNITGPFNQAALEVMAKFPLVTIEKYQGPNSGYHYPKEQWVCCQEDRIVETLKSVKKINPNITGIFYYNIVVDFPQYRLHQSFDKNETWWLHDDSGNVIRVKADGHSDPDLLVYDTTQDIVADMFIHACLDLLPSGAVDGCFVDRPIVEGTLSGNFSPTRQLELLDSHITTLQKMQTLLKRGPLIANHDYGTPGINANMIAKFQATEENIALLQWNAKRGKLTEAHLIDARCDTDAGILDSLAAFLIGAGEYSYFGCGPWFSAAVTIDSQWKASYDKPLGAPLGLAVKQGSVYTRKFASGTSVEFDCSTNKGSIEWLS